MRTILVILIVFSSIELSANFSKNGNIVSDSRTGLEWQDNNETNSTRKTWENAIEYCESLNLDGYGDWRLPNINELTSIIDRSKSEPAIFDGFEYVKSRAYFTSTSLTRAGYSGWFVNFYRGVTDTGGGYTKQFSTYVRCVRTGQ